MKQTTLNGLIECKTLNNITQIYLSVIQFFNQIQDMTPAVNWETRLILVYPDVIIFVSVMNESYYSVLLTIYWQIVPYIPLQNGMETPWQYFYIWYWVVPVSRQYLELLRKTAIKPQRKIWDYVESTHKHISPDAQEGTLRSTMI